MEEIKVEEAKATEGEKVKAIELEEEKPGWFKKSIKWVVGGLVIITTGVVGYLFGRGGKDDDNDDSEESTENNEE